ncbi:hypothetical protein [Streptomyces bacillaris]|uniref:hypothetical protein n=1 Tax=Streptomyces bacillaris TaxID=68179 RepID=UPI00345FB6EB
MINDKDRASEATRTCAAIRELTARADQLLLELRGSGASWAELATVINPEDPPRRSTVQRRVEAADRRESERHLAEVAAGVAELTRLKAAARAAVPLLLELIAAVTPRTPGPRLNELDPARYRAAADAVEAAIEGVTADDQPTLWPALWKAEHLLRGAGDAIADGRGILTDRYQAAADDLEQLAPDPDDHEAMLRAAGL